MKTLRRTTVLVLGASIWLACTAGRADTLDAVQNAAIRAQIPLNYTNYNGATLPQFPPLIFVPTASQPDSLIGGMLFVMFDLTAYAGKFADGNADLTWRVAWADGNYPVTFSIRPVLSNWTQDTVTWDNFIGNPTGTFFQNVIGPEMDRVTVPGSGGWVGDLITFTVSNDVLQSWMDNALDNRGVALVPVTAGGAWSRNGNDIWFTTGSARPAADKPRLTFTVQSVNIPPNTPTNLAPADGAIDVATAPTLTASAFSDPDGDGQSASRWQISSDPEFSSAGIADGWDSNSTTSQLTSATVPGGTLDNNTRYWWRVRYQDDSSEGPKWSEWSEPTRFDTALDLLDPIQKYAVAMAQIWPAQPNSNINSQSGVPFNLVNPVSNGVPAGFIMIQFDLAFFSSYTGIVAQSAGDLAAACSWTQVSTPPVFHAYPLLAPWDETNVTWNNYIGDWSTWTNKLGPDLGFEVMDTIGMVGHWPDIAAELIQTWISHPVSNYGLALVPEGTGNTIWRASPLPDLTFELSNTNAPVPDKPTNITPADGAKGVTSTPTLTSSAYAGPGSHAASQWRIARDMAMSDIVWDSGVDPSNLVTVTVPSNTLSMTSRYYWDVRHINTEGGKSAYSDATMFDTEVVAGCSKLGAAANAMIMYPGDLQQSNFNGSSLVRFWPYGNSNGVHGAIVLTSFDLGIFEGFQASQDGKFTIYYGYVDGNYDFYMSCYRVLQPWDESSVTWESFVGPGETNFWPLLGEAFGSAEAVNNGSSVWTISQATIQEWLDDGQTNFGLAVYPDQGNANLFMQTRAAGARGPSLDICIIPEPGVLAGVVLAALACRWRRRN